jgi:hypothetical protein
MNGETLSVGMTRRLGAAISLCTSLALTTPAIATHLEPRKAKRFRADLVTAYEPCVAANTFGDESGSPACVPPVRSDPACGFGPKGSGRVKLAIARSKLALSLNMRGLDAGCEDAFLNVGLTVQATSDDCAGSACTVELIRPGYSGCQVRNGRCAFGTKGPTTFIVPANARSGLEIQAVDVFRVNARPFTMGLLLP